MQVRITRLKRQRITVNPKCQSNKPDQVLTNGQKNGIAIRHTQTRENTDHVKLKKKELIQVTNLDILPSRKDGELQLACV